MKTITLTMWTALTLLSWQSGFARWADVRPYIQEIDTVTGLPVNLRVGQNTILMFGDSVEWVANELSDRLEQLTGSSFPVVLVEDEEWSNHSLTPIGRNIQIGLWEGEILSEEPISWGEIPRRGAHNVFRATGLPVGRQKKWDTLSVKLMEGFGS